MDHRIELFVPGRPIAKPQRYTKAAHPQWGWRDKVAYTVKSFREDNWPLDEPVALGMQFFVYSKGKRRPPDFKNLWACVEDSLTRVLYTDDFWVNRVLCPSGRTIIENSGQQEGVALLIEWGGKA